MIIYLPCKLGETFITQKFLEWKEGKRVYISGTQKTLTGFFANELNTRCLAIPTIITNSGLFSYDDTGEFEQEFIPKYKISVELKRKCKLSEIGFPGNRIAHLCGLSTKNGKLYADFVTKDRYEHLLYEIKDNIYYYDIDTNNAIIKDCDIQYIKSKDKENIKYNNQVQLCLFDYI